MKLIIALEFKNQRDIDYIKDIYDGVVKGEKIAIDEVVLVRDSGDDSFYEFEFIGIEESDKGDGYERI